MRSKIPFNILLPLRPSNVNPGISQPPKHRDKIMIFKLHDHVYSPHSNAFKINREKS